MSHTRGERANTGNVKYPTTMLLPEFFTGVQYCTASPPALRYLPEGYSEPTSARGEWASVLRRHGVGVALAYADNLGQYGAGSRPVSGEARAAP